VVVTVIVTFPEVVNEGGLKLQEEAAGKPLQLKLTVPAADPMLMPIAYWAGCPAFTVRLAVLETTETIGLVNKLIWVKLLPEPPPEAVAAIVVDPGAARATLNTNVMSG
jgi:hypothetical protein